MDNMDILYMSPGFFKILSRNLKVLLSENQAQMKSVAVLHCCVPFFTAVSPSQEQAIGILRVFFGVYFLGKIKFSSKQRVISMLAI